MIFDVGAAASSVGQQEINTGGFTIVSTIDPAIQDNTVQAIDNLPDDRPENNRVGTVTMGASTQGQSIAIMTCTNNRYMTISSGPGNWNYSCN